MFTKLTDTADCKYRSKCNFAKPRSPRLNTNHLQCARCIKALFLFMLGLFIWFAVYAQYQVGGVHGFLVPVTFYSYWGIISAFIAQLFSAIACHREGWFKTAYIATEISYGINTMIMFFFWLILIPTLFLTTDPSQQGRTRSQWENILMVLMHFAPWVCNVLDLWMTDMALERSHWWMCMVTVFPVYMLFNLYGSMTVGSFTTKEIGTLYGFEHWVKYPAFSVFLFFI